MPLSVVESSVSLIEELLGKCDKIAVKKLKNNDRKWADGPEFGHQNGPYIPLELREGSFFPKLENANPDKPHIFECNVQTCWVRTGELKKSRLVNYSNKGSECHLTRVPKPEFAGISPASWFVVGRQEMSGEQTYYCLVIDSADIEGSTFVETIFELDSAFEYDIFDADKAFHSEAASHGIVEELFQALMSGSLESLMTAYAFPKTAELAAMAQGEYLKRYRLTDLNPFKMERPGDALMQISRDIEYRLFRQYSARHYSAKLLQMLSGGKAAPDLKTVVTELVTRFDDIYKEVMVSAGQRSKSRAGYSFEQHVQRMLTDGGIPYQEQRFIGNQRPDFILPSLELYREPTRARDEAFILSLKTLLRERWKQVLSENKESDLYLGTVDDGIAGESVEEMNSHGIYLVVPEQLKDSDYTEYKNHDNVITFHDFFNTELCKRRKLWLKRGLELQFSDA